MDNQQTQKPERVTFRRLYCIPYDSALHITTLYPNMPGDDKTEQTASEEFIKNYKDEGQLFDACIVLKRQGVENKVSVFLLIRPSADGATDRDILGDSFDDCLSFDDLGYVIIPEEYKQVPINNTITKE